MVITVDRVLPWRRHSEPAIAQLEALVETFKQHHPDSDSTMIELAHRMAADAHAGQLRKSGEPYIGHPIAVANIVAGIGLDDVTISAALLHDAVEDTSVSLEDLEATFGAEVAQIVDGVTKLDRIHFNSKEDQQAASVRKMIVAIAKDLRVIIIKLADRLHNMQTLAALPEEKQHRIATETREIYAALAHRLGMQEVKVELEDLAFASLHPKRYAEIDHMVSMRTPEREMYIEQVVQDVQARLLELGIDADVVGRPKHLWSIYEKMIVKDLEFDDIYDLVGIRVVVGDVKDCYGALGSIHASWRPVQGRFKDYIAMPKFNLYQSLHTTVIGPQGKALEVQIRTKEMHSRAENGVAAHWEYKDRSGDGDLAWLGRIVDWQGETEDPGEFMDSLKTDLEQDEVFVFTPKGKVVTLPIDSTPVDFAYAVHTEVGHACIGARVNGRLVTLETKLDSGDNVEIFTAKKENHGPSRDWLDFVVSGKARSKVRQWHIREQRDDAIVSGREELTLALRKEGLPVQQVLGASVLDEVGAEMNYVERDALYAAVGAGHVSAKSLAAQVAKALHEEKPDEQMARGIIHHRERRTGDEKRATGVHVEGLDDVMVRLSRCCTPVPPDEIMGFITRGRGVSVHRSDCANAVSLATDQASRVLEVDWDGSGGSGFVAAIEIKAIDRSGLLRDITDKLSDQRVNILSCSTVTDDDRVSRLIFEFELGDSGHLDSLISVVKGIDSVYDAYRVMPGSGKAIEVG
jgi:GTP diphosphokinase / guanosine-3',5'-bis(diphosphate) 3'-diphosphatase